MSNQYDNISKLSVVEDDENNLLANALFEINKLFWSKYDKLAVS